MTAMLERASPGNASVAGLRPRPGVRTSPGVRPGAGMASTSRCRIAEASRRTGVSPSALRAWERQGLVKPGRTGAGYRLYDDADLDRLAWIRRMRQEHRVNAPGIRRLLDDGSSPSVPEPNAQRLRELRRERGLSLHEASARSGLSPSFVSALERGVSGASVATLQRLLATYGSTTLDLLTGPRRAGRVVRSRKGRALELAGSGVRIEQLSTGQRQLEPQLFVLAPGATSDGAYTHAGEEFLFVLSGSLNVWLGERERYRLGEGDALSFPSTLPHRWRNHASRETRLLWINTPPTF